MNALNYTSLEMSKRLIESGIVLETDYCWRPYPNPVLSLRCGYGCPDTDTLKKNRLCVPAPSMSELWRELPIEFIYDTNRVFLFATKKRDQKTYCGYAHNENAVCNSVKSNANPCDALAELLIWVRKGEKGG